MSNPFVSFSDINLARRNEVVRQASRQTKDKIKVTSEGSPGIYLVTALEIERYLNSLEQDTFHCSIPSNSLVLGANWDKLGVIKEVNKSERLVILTGGAAKNNLGHALACVASGGLTMFDIGPITEDMLSVEVS